MEAMKHSERECVCTCVCVYACIYCMCVSLKRLTQRHFCLNEKKKKYWWPPLISFHLLLSLFMLTHSILFSFFPLIPFISLLSSQLTLLLSACPYHSPNLTLNPSHPAFPLHCPSSSTSLISSSPAGSLLPFLLISPVTSVPISRFHCAPVVPHTCPLNHSNSCSSHSHLLLIGTTSHSPCSCFFMLFQICSFLCPCVPRNICHSKQYYARL